ncbi:MAG: hypothetical protein KME13_08375 [Myxacorys californica WJT36-NPBG1]|jgi:hypothetical protein|nr:hypothetical protein [Myxacorys californica WJT36-NPBG1]
MNSNVPTVTYPTLRILLLSQIDEAIRLWEDVSVTRRSLHPTAIRANALDSELSHSIDVVKRVPSETLISTYRSAIALKLAPHFDYSAEQTANQLVEFLYKMDTKTPGMSAILAESLLRDLTVAVVSPGFLEFRFSDRAIATWLQSLIDLKDKDLRYGSFEMTRNNSDFDSGSSKVFFCQSTHARCCSLLRLARQRDLASIEQACWLNRSDQLLLQESVERKLLSQFVAVTDGFLENNVLEMAVGLSHAFHQFERSCRIVGASQALDRHLLQCRLGLVMITQRLLRSLLEQKLGVPAPLEL